MHGGGMAGGRGAHRGEQGRGRGRERGTGRWMRCLNIPIEFKATIINCVVNHSQSMAKGGQTVRFN